MSFLSIPHTGPPRENQHLQFARLLKELDQAGCLTPLVLDILATETEQTYAEVTGIILAATEAFDDYIDLYLSGKTPILHELQ